MYLIGGGIDETLSVGHVRCLIDKYGLEAKSKAAERDTVASPTLLSCNAHNNR